jgi:imidazolonepropionase-like amidohydrolase
MRPGWLARVALCSAALGSPGTAAAQTTALLGATLLDGTGRAAVKDAAVVVRGDSIACAGPRAACPVPAGAKTVDLAGHWITPGLVDSHVHFSQTGWADGRPDSLDVRGTHPYERTSGELAANPERLFRSFLCSGVTAVFDVGGYPWTFGLQGRSAGEDAPHVRSAGPLLSTRDHWLNLPAERQFIHLDSPEAAERGVAYLQARGASAVKIWYIPVRDKPREAMAAWVTAAGDAARKAGLPLIVHATGLDEAKTAVRAGAKLLVHGVDDRPVDDEFLALLRQKGTIYCPTLIVSRGYVRMFEAAVARKAAEIDDPNGCVSPWVRERVAATASVDPKLLGSVDVVARAARTSEREKTMAGNLKRVAEAGLPIAMGTDAGNPMTLHGPSVYGEMEAMQTAGLSPMQVLVASTSVAARAMGIESRAGTVEKGKLADLVVLGADPAADVRNWRRIRFVVRAGQPKTPAELRESR